MKNKGILIELTALLDVILIMLFAVMINANAQVDAAVEDTGAAQAELAQTQSALSDAEAALESALRQNAAFDVVKDNCLTVSVTLERTDGGRRLYIESAGYEKTVEFSWDDTAYAFNALRSGLWAAVKGREEPAAFIVLRYDSDTVYKADYDMVTTAVNTLKQDTGVYFAEYDTRSGADETE